ncbi:MAG: hypothetical protein ACOC57_06385 [Acidobacteriota bacterium]
MKYLKAATERDVTPGIIAVIQSFGSRINFCPSSFSGHRGRNR